MRDNVAKEVAIPASLLKGVQCTFRESGEQAVPVEPLEDCVECLCGRFSDFHRSLPDVAWQARSQVRLLTLLSLHRATPVPCKSRSNLCRFGAVLACNPRLKNGEGVVRYFRRAHEATDLVLCVD